LIAFFGAGLERMSTHDGTQYMKLLTDMLASLSRARQKSMKQTELHAYLVSQCEKVSAWFKTQKSMMCAIIMVPNVIITYFYYAATNTILEILLAT
jgi:ABC-type transport system involved in cytochrome bd biosynthesis fused ATPase/permease subunit